MVWPKTFRIDGDGSVSEISPEHKQFSLVQDSISGDHVLLRNAEQKAASMELVLVDHDHALLQFIGAPLPPWKLTRVGENDDVNVATSWPEQKQNPQTRSEEMATLAQKIHDMTVEDQAVRTSKFIPGTDGHIGDGYNDGLGVYVNAGTVCAWTFTRRNLESAGMRIRQNGDVDGVAMFDPSNREQVRLALKLAGIIAWRYPRVRMAQSRRALWSPALRVVSSSLFSEGRGTVGIAVEGC